MASGSDVRPERARWPRLAAPAQAELRSLLPGGYAGYTEATAPRHLLMPATTVVPLVMKLQESAYRPPQFLMGAHGSYSVLEGDCAPSYIEVRLAPIGAYTLLGLPPDELSGLIVDLTDVLGPAGRRLAERVRDAPTWRQRFTLVDEFLLRRLERGRRPSAEVTWAWQRLTATDGAVPIGQLASEVGWSHKHLITMFTRQVGLKPKTAARLVRFDAVGRRLDGHRPLDWGQLAAEVGYADQAHLIRDFREFTGSTPTEFVAQLGQSHPALAPVVPPERHFDRSETNRR